MHFDYTQYKQRGFAPIIILVGILILAAIGGGYYFLKIKTPEQRACTMDAKICPNGTSVGRSGPNCEFSPCPQTSPNPTPDETVYTEETRSANWKTYTNTREEYSIKYPLSWYARDGIVTDYDLQVTEQLANAIEHLTIQIIVWDNPSKLSTEAYVSQLDAGPDAPQTTSTEKVTIGGILGIKRVENRYSITSPIRSTQPTMVVYLAHSDKTIIISASPANSLLIKTFDQILSTFKFLK